jgi:hypothetical protein
VIERRGLMSKDKIEEIIAASKLSDILRKKDVEVKKSKKVNIAVVVLAILGAVVAIAAIAYAIYRYFTPDYLDDFDDDFDDDDFDDDFDDDDFELDE